MSTADLSAVLEVSDRKPLHDIRMIQRALDQGWVKPWDIADEVRVKLADRMWKIVEDPESNDPRAKVAAARVLQSLGRDNIELARAFDQRGETAGDDNSTQITQINIGQHLSAMASDQRRQWDEAAKLLDQPK